MENMENLERIRRVTQYYDQLQGLRQVPFGVLFLLLAVWKAGWWPWFDKWQPLSGLFFIGAAMIAFWWVGLYYERTFGKVWQSADSRRNGTILAIAFLVGLYLVGWAEYKWHWSVSGTGLFTAVSLVTYYFQTGSFRLQHLVLAGLMAVVSLLPLFNLLPVEQVYLWGERGVVGVAIFGLLWLVSGLVDHWLLTRALRQTTN
ncbi:MAG: hypothetical protein CL608_05260 [Anaerolineaceae bacterium]|nr:hypothetical protein [Anaerolineaceae bacterium]